jgi:hypothetical protein
MFDMRSFALNLLSQNPNVRANPQMQEMLNVIQSGDSVRGQQIAENLCNTYGVSKENAIANARNFFHI